MARRRKPVTLFDVIQKGSPVMMTPRRVDPSMQGVASRAKIESQLPVTVEGRSLRERLALWLLRRSETTSKPAEPAPVVLKEKRPALIPPTQARAEVPETSSRGAANAMERLRAELRSAPSIVEETPTPQVEAPLISKEEISELQQIEAEPKGPSALSTLTTKLSREASEFFERFGASARDVGNRASKIRIRMPSWISRLVNLVDRRHVALVIGMGGLFVFSFALGRVLLQDRSDVRPDVLDVTPGGAGEISASLAPTPLAPPVVERRIEANLPLAAVGPRTARLNYVIVQSYLNEVDANSAVDVLAANNITATVEVNLPNWGSKGSTWYSVVGMVGFERLSNNPSYADYIARLNKVSDNEYNRTINKRFAPTPYRWPG